MLKPLGQLLSRVRDVFSHTQPESSSVTVLVFPDGQTLDVCRVFVPEYLSPQPLHDLQLTVLGGFTLGVQLHGSPHVLSWRHVPSLHCQRS